MFLASDCFGPQGERLALSAAGFYLDGVRKWNTSLIMLYCKLTCVLVINYLGHVFQ